MKKSLLTILVFGICFFMSSFAIAQDCDGLVGEAYDLCVSYCEDKLCATDDPNGSSKSCARLKENLLKVTGTDVMPCDIVACGVCASLNPDTGSGTVGICEEMKSVDCDDQGLENYGENTCEAVTLPLPGGAPGCDDIPPGGMFGTFIPDCQYVGGLEFVCVRFLQGVQLGDGEACPAPPECTDEQLDNLNMPR